jgi:hypothetical protein
MLKCIYPSLFFSLSSWERDSLDVSINVVESSKLDCTTLNSLEWEDFPSLVDSPILQDRGRVQYLLTSQTIEPLLEPKGKRRFPPGSFPGRSKDLRGFFVPISDLGGIRPCVLARRL